MSIAKTPILKVGGYIKDLFKSSIVGKISGGKMLNTDYWFESEIKKSKYTNRISRVSSIDEYLCRDC